MTGRLAPAPTPGRLRPIGVDHGVTLLAAAALKGRDALTSLTPREARVRAARRRGRDRT